MQKQEMDVSIFEDFVNSSLEKYIHNTHFTKLDFAEKFIINTPGNFYIIKDGERLHKHTNTNELDFYKYHRINSNERLSSVIPQSFENHNLKEPIVEMENLRFDMVNPITLEIQIGGKELSKEINFSAKFKNWYTGSLKRCWKITGGTGISKSKLLAGANSVYLLDNFLNMKFFTEQLINKFLEDLIQIKDVALSSEFAFVDSSIFVIIDSTKIKTKLIDYAFAFNREQDSTYGKYDFLRYRKRFQIGMNNLIQQVVNYKKKILS